MQKHQGPVYPDGLKLSPHHYVHRETEGDLG